MTDMFSNALALHKAGRLEQAAALYAELLNAEPGHADAWNLLGVIAHQKGDSGTAVDLIQKAIGLDASRPSYHVNLASAFRRLKRFDESIQSCEAALVLQPDLIEARVSLGMAHQALAHWVEAEAQFRWLADHRQNDSRGLQLLANCLREQGRVQDAQACYRDALARNPADALAQLGLGTLLLGEKNLMGAEGHLRRATELLPQVVNAWTNYGACLVRLGREREALPVLQAAMQLSPNEPGLGVNLGQAYLGCGDFRAAENCFATVLKFQPDFPGALQGLADVYRETDRVEESIPLYERVGQLEPAGKSYQGLAGALWDLGNVDRAIAELRAGIGRHPDDAENHVRLATILAAGGDLERAVAECRTALQIQPGQPSALIDLAQTLRGKIPEADLASLKACLNEPVAEVLRSGVHFALAQVADARGLFAEAAGHIEHAHQLKKLSLKAHGQEHDPAQGSCFTDRLIEVFGPVFFARTAGYGRAEERPVFVVGMPRSGTTLVEQILASHPQVYGAGERRFAYQSLLRLARELGRPAEPLECVEHVTRQLAAQCADWHLEQLRQLDGGRSPRIVDKMPDNHSMLGWLAVTLPKARIIHCRRDVRDVALSCWMTNFAKMSWANDLDHIAGRIRNYQRIMAHWRQVLPTPMLEIDYEQLVVDQEVESRRLVDWLGLGWDPACLAFHRTERLVKTASVTQVRQPMYSRSVGRWRHYEDVLRPFLRALEL